MDSTRMGAGELIDYANKINSDAIFLIGCLQDGGYIKPDLERDKVQPTEVIQMIDLDSMIWVTCQPQFKKWIDIYMHLVIRQTPSIQRHNHVYIDFHHPPSEENPDAMRPTWKYKLNQLHHLFLGKIGGATEMVQLYMVFHCMTHKHPQVPHYSNIVQWDLQGILWNHVITPAMKSVLSPSDEPYAGLDAEHVAFKDSDGNNPATYPLRPEQLVEFIAIVDELVSVLIL